MVLHVVDGPATFANAKVYQIDLVVEKLLKKWPGQAWVVVGRIWGGYGSDIGGSEYNLEAKLLWIANVFRKEKNPCSHVALLVYTLAGSTTASGTRATARSVCQRNDELRYLPK